MDKDIIKTSIPFFDEKEDERTEVYFVILFYFVFILIYLIIINNE